MKRSDFRAEHLANFLVRARFVLLPAALLLAACAWPVSQRLALERSISSLYAPDDPVLRDYLESKSLFGGDELVLVAYEDRELFQPDSLRLTTAAERRLRRLAAELSEIPGVVAKSTQDFASAGDPVRVTLRGRIPLKVPLLAKDVFEMSKGVLVGEDRESAAVMIRLADESDAPVPRTETIRRIREVADGFDREIYVVGEPVQIHDLFHFVEEDGERFLWSSLAVLACVLLVLFGNPRWVILPLLLVVVTIVWTRASLVLGGGRLSMVSSMLNSLVTILGIATATHMAVHFREHRRTRDRRDALRETIADLAPAIFWTCATTAVGFLALLSSSIVPVRSFGTMMGLATMLLLAAAASILPGGVLFGGRWTDPRANLADRSLSGALVGGTRWTRGKPRLLAALSVAVVAFSVVGFFRLKIETDFSRNFRADSDIVRSLDFVERRLGGAGTWEVNFPAPAELDEDYLNRVRRLTADLRALKKDFPQLTKVVSLTDALDSIPSLFFFTSTPQAKQEILRQVQPEVLTGLYNPARGRMRIMLRGVERQPAETKQALVAAVKESARESFPRAKATGPFVLLAELIASLLDDQLTSFAIAVLGISLMMIVAFGGVRIGLVSLVPNILPIVLVVGTMGWLGIAINIGTAMIACVSMGLTIDFSIHYIAGYRRGLDRGLSAQEALEGTQRQVGRALVFATLALIAGFSVLTVSHFIPLVHFGVLVSAAMLGGLLGNLVLLPGLLRWTQGNDHDRSAEKLSPSETHVTTGA